MLYSFGAIRTMGPWYAKAGEILWVLQVSMALLILTVRLMQLDVHLLEITCPHLLQIPQSREPGKKRAGNASKRSFDSFPDSQQYSNTSDEDDNKPRMCSIIR